jgi:hypothetical protein
MKPIFRENNFPIFISKNIKNIQIFFPTEKKNSTVIGQFKCSVTTKHSKVEKKAK